MPFHRAELSLAAGLLRLLRDRARPAAARSPTSTGTRRWPGCAARTGADLAPEQEQAVRLALTAKVAVLTGGPGCGKSFTVRSIVALAAREEGQGHAGRADRPGRQAAGRADRAPTRPPCTGCCSCGPAGTPPTTGTTRSTPTWWWSTRPPCWTCCWPTSWSRRSPPGAHLLLVGDVDQLPSRRRRGGAARPARRRRPIPRVRLTQIFRQAAASPAWSPTPTGSTPASRPSLDGMTDFFLFAVRRHRGDRRADRRRGRPAASRARFGLDPRRDVQVLAPMHRGPAGAGALNSLLQQAAHPAPARACPNAASAGGSSGSATRSPRSATTTTRAQAGVFNGTVGVVTAHRPRGPDA